MRSTFRKVGWLSLVGGLVVPWTQGTSLSTAHAQPAPSDDPPAEAPVPPVDEPPADEAIVPPRITNPPLPAYPEEVEGRGTVEVVVELTIEADGSTSDAAVASGEGPRFDEAALVHVRELRFEPARRGDQAIAVRIRYAVVFTPEAEVTDTTAPVAPAPAPSEGPVDPSAAASLDEDDDDAASAEGSEPSFGATAEVEAPTTATTERVIEGEILREVPGTRGDPLRAIEVLPGVGRTGLGDGTPRLRGASGFESVALISGTPVPLLYHFGGLTSVIHPELIERVTLYPGNFPVAYGRATSGVVTADIRDPRRDGFHGSVELSTLDGSALIEFPIGERFALALAARRSLLDLYFASFVPEDAYQVIAAPVYYDAQAVGLLDMDDHQLRIFAYGAGDSLELLLDQPYDNNPDVRGDALAEVQFGRIQAELTSQLSDRVEQTLMLTYGRTAQTTNIIGTSGELTSDALFARTAWRAGLSQGISIHAGLDLQGSILRGSYRGERPIQNEGSLATGSANDDVTIEDRTVRQFEPGAFAELALRPTETLLVVPGIRVDYTSQIEEASIDPRLTVRQQLGPRMTLKAGAGRYSQAPVYWEAMEELGNPDLEPVSAWQLSGGAEYELAPSSLWLDVEGYYKYLSNRVVATEGGRPPYFENDGTGHVFGLETSLRVDVGDRLLGFLAYSLSRSERIDHDEPARLFDEDETHNLSAAVTYRFGDSGWSLGTRFRLTSGHLRTPIVGSTFDAAEGQYQPIYGRNNGDRQPYFHQLDVRAEKEWDWDVFRLTAFLELINAYNSENPEGYDYSYDFREQEPVTGLPLFPNLGLRGQW